MSPNPIQILKMHICHTFQNLAERNYFINLRYSFSCQSLQVCAERELVLQSQYSMYLGVVLIILLMTLHSAHVVIVDFQLLFIRILTFLQKGLFCPWKVVYNVIMLLPVQVRDAWKTWGQRFFVWLIYLFSLPLRLSVHQQKELSLIDCGALIVFFLFSLYKCQWQQVLMCTNTLAYSATKALQLLGLVLSRESMITHFISQELV